MAQHVGQLVRLQDALIGRCVDWLALKIIHFVGACYTPSRSLNEV